MGKRLNDLRKRVKHIEHQLGDVAAQLEALTKGSKRDKPAKTEALRPAKKTGRSAPRRKPSSKSHSKAKAAKPVSAAAPAPATAMTPATAV